MKPTSVTVSAASHLKYVAVEVAEMAAEFARHFVGHAAAAGTKSTPTDVVTETDLATERLIRSELSKRCPGSAVLGEEFDTVDGHNAIGWIVDPIDGTVNFLYDLPVVSVSIAATLNGETVAGAVVDVVRGDVFSAALNEGAERNGTPISCSAPTSISTSLIGTGFSYDSSIRFAQSRTLNRVLPACRDIRTMGSSALNLCWVGCGRLDGYYQQDTEIYDYAAGALVASEAGATVLVGAKKPDDMTVAASPAIADALFGLLEPIG